jgi:hypothetical protein
MANTSNWTEMVQTDDINKEVVESTELSVYTGVGNIEVKPSSDNFIKVKAIKKVNSDDETKNQELMNNIEINLSNDVGKLSLKAYPKNKKEQDLWEWKTKSYDPMDLNIDFVIEVPKNIVIYTLNSGIGKISIGDLFGSFKAKTGVGDIEFNKTSFAQKSVIEAKTGNIKIDIAKLNSANEISIDTNVGDIKLNVPADSKCTIETAEFMEKKRKESMNGGGTLIKAKASMGRVSINK